MSTKKLQPKFESLLHKDEGLVTPPQPVVSNQEDLRFAISKEPMYATQSAVIKGDAPVDPKYVNIIPPQQATAHTNPDINVKPNQIAPPPSPAPAPTAPMTFEEYLASIKTNADTQYNSAVSSAETERQRAVVDARNNYDQSRSAYGSNAAALSAMGLTGSGFSGYLDSKAYAQMQGDVNAAARNKQLAVNNAETIKANSYAQADAMRMDYLNQKETNKNNMYQSILSNIDAYTPEQITALAQQYGFSTEELTGLNNAYTVADTKRKQNEEKTRKANYIDILNNIEKYDQESIDELSTLFNLTDAEKATLTEAYTKAENDAKTAAATQAYRTMYDILATGNLNYSASYLNEFGTAEGMSQDQIAQLKQLRLRNVEALLGEYGDSYEKRDLDKLLDVNDPAEKAVYDEYYEKLKSKLANVPDSDLFINGQPIGRAEAEAIKASMVENGVDTTNIDNFIHNYHDVATAGISFKRDPGKDSSGKDNKNIVLEKNGTKYRVQYNGDNHSSGSVKQAATMAGLVNGDVFMYQGKIYMVGSNGDCYGLERRDNSYKKEWNELVKELKSAKEKTNTTATIDTFEEIMKSSLVDPSWEELLKSKYGIT